MGRARTERRLAQLAVKVFGKDTKKRRIPDCWQLTLTAFRRYLTHFVAVIPVFLHEIA